MIEGYRRIHAGHWWQEERTGHGPAYDITYVKERYDTYTTTQAMSALRYDVIRSYFGNFSSVLDVGYGNGDFLRHCHARDHKAFGYDISGYPLPAGVERSETMSKSVGIVTFFDSLEHFEDADLSGTLRGLRAEAVVISCPLLHETAGSDSFRNWKHRRPNEHFHHFNERGLRTLISYSDYTVTWTGCPEDQIRGTLPDGKSNIITVIAERN
jgi:SAM-dependent methyltransferase